ncbi:MAG: EF-Tu/IF-2/RF-3 family GTPase [Planctomycetota bacterium]
MANLDEALVERYLAEEELGPEELVAGLRRLTLEARALPVLCGAALRGIGVEPLLDGVVRFLPSPLDRPRPRGRDRHSGAPVVLQPDPEAPLAAQVFKLVATRHGNVAWVRVYQGTLEAGDQVRNSRVGKPERAQALLRILAGDTEQVERAVPGDVVAIKGFRNVRTGDGVTAPGSELDFPSWTFPLPVLSRSIEPRKVGDRDRLLECLDLYAAQDPTFDWKQDEETGQVLISGMGELHLEVISHALARDFKVDCVLGKPRVAYRETLGRAVRLDEEVRLRLPAREVAARVVVELLPDPALDKCAAEDALEAPEGQEKRFAPVREVARHALELELRAGPGHGFPMTQVRGRVLRCETPEGGPPPAEDVEIAVSLLLRGLADSPDLRLLEPWMRVAVTAPEEFLSPALGEIQALGGQVQQVEVQAPWAEVRATAPLSRLLDFTTRLRSVTQGRAAASMELEAYHPVPAEVRDALLGD